MKALEQLTPDEVLAILVAKGVTPIEGGSGYMNDLSTPIIVGRSVKFQTHTTTPTGAGVDLSSGDGQAFAIIVSGAYTDGTHAVALQESRNDNAADEHAAADAYAAIPAGSINDTLNNISDDAIQVVTFRHREPFVRAVVTVTGSPGTGAVYGVLIGAFRRHA